MNRNQNEESVAEQESRNWAELPADVTSMILAKVGVIDVLTSAQSVCSSWLRVCRDPAMWRHIDMRNLEEFWDMNDDLEMMCRLAVDRSNGQLFSINIDCFGTDELLRYIASRSRNLRILRLVSCDSISDVGFSEVVKEFPLLEELELSYCSLSQEALEAVGIHCPCLKSLKLNDHGFGYRSPSMKCDDDAIAIANNIPGLCHLQLFGNKLTNIGLQAILDGCPNLESLDLRRCFNVKLVGDLEKICAKRIKDLRRPDDSTADYEFNAEDYSSSISDIGHVLGEDDFYDDIYFDDIYFDDLYEFSDSELEYDYIFND